MMKGTIALDIDGTITRKDHLIPDRVSSYLQILQKQGWQFVLITGRTFSFAMSTLTKLDFPFFLGVQNGADLLIMPEKRQVKQNYLTRDVIRVIDQLYQKQQGDFIVYAGFEKGDFCYYRPEKHSPYMLDYLEKLKKLSPLPWQPVTSFDIRSQNLFPLVKCFGSKQMCETIENKLKTKQDVRVSVIRDPIDPSLYLALITHEYANKGNALSYFMKEFHIPSPVIAGGDDNNDIPLLHVGDIRIAMDGSPQKLQNLADIIAPPAVRGGIVEGLKEAIERLES